MNISLWWALPFLALRFISVNQFISIFESSPFSYVLHFVSCCVEEHQFNLWKYLYTKYTDENPQAITIWFIHQSYQLVCMCGRICSFDRIVAHLLDWAKQPTHLCATLYTLCIEIIFTFYVCHKVYGEFIERFAANWYRFVIYRLHNRFSYGKRFFIGIFWFLAGIINICRQVVVLFVQLINSWTLSTGIYPSHLKCKYCEAKRMKILLSSNVHK